MSKMPVLFVGHGSPENAVEKNGFTRAWREMAKRFEKPKAVLCVSAHWVTPGKTLATAMAKPGTIHDFYGFPKELYDATYPAPGSKALAEKVCSEIEAAKAGVDYSWGLDHGAWIVLKNMYPKADVPAVQLSLDYSLPLKTHYEIGKELAFLREEGVLVLGSGNLVHNLYLLRFDGGVFPWAMEFDAFVKRALEKKDHKALVDYKKHKSAELAHPTNEHYLPLLYCTGAAKRERVEFFCEEIFAGSVSMRAAGFGL